MPKSQEFARSLLKRFKWNSILFRYGKKVLLFFFLPMLLINGIIFFLYSNAMRNEFYSVFETSCTKTSSALDALFSETETLYFQFSNNRKVTAHFLEKESMLFKADSVKRMNDIQDLLKVSHYPRAYLETICLYSIHNNYVLSSTRSGTLASFEDTQWYQHYAETGETNFLVSSVNPTSGAVDRISACYGFYTGTEFHGLLVFDISANYIRELIRPDLSHNLNALYILDRSGNRIFASGSKENLWETPSWERVEDLSKDRTANAVRRADCYRSSIANNRITLCFEVSPQAIRTYAPNMSLIALLLLLLAVLIPLFMSVYLSVVFYKSIHNIVLSLSSNPEDQNQDEINFIIHNISNLTQSKENFETELVQKIQQLKQAQSLALQMQFNPHFLFNALNMINLFVAKLAGRNNPASKSILLLSDLLYASMKTNDYVLTLQEELDYENKYLEFLEFQYDNSFDVIWDVRENTRDCKVLKLMLQPIIENAFHHGWKMCPPEERFYIRISSTIEAGHLIVSVANNGNGIPPEQLRQLQQMLASDDILQSKHIGLNNVNQRVKLLYGDAYGCQVDSDEHGFRVIIHLPANT